MPIQFRCQTCDRLLSIARRKAGNSVTCPKCKGSVRVPVLAGMAITSDGPGGRDTNNDQPVAVGPSPKTANGKKLDSMPLFERPDFESLLAPAVGRNVDESRSRRDDNDPDEEPELIGDEPEGIVLSRGKLMLIVGIFALLLGLAFTAGYYLAASTLRAKPSPSACTDHLTTRIA